MTSLVKGWIPSENYWVIHPMAKEFGPFKLLYKKDKSKSKKDSSKIMWAVAMLVDPHEDNLIRNNPIKEKQILIATDYLGDSKFNWEHPEIKDLIKFYTENCLTILEQELNRYVNKLVERGDFIESVGYTMDTLDERGRVIKGTATQLDKMFTDSGKIFTEIENIKEKLSKENAEGHLKGGAAESAGESGLI